MRLVRPWQILLILLAGSPLEAADIFLGTSKERTEKIAVWIPPFGGGSRSKGSVPSPGSAGSVNEVQLVESVFKDDLNRVQLFNLIDFVKAGPPVDFTNGPNQDVIALARNAGVFAIAWAKVYPLAGQWVMEAHAYETGRGEPVIRVKMKADSPRPLAHRFSDKLVAYFTGEKGISETRIVYLSDREKGKEVYLMDYDGLNKMRLTADQSIVLPPRWSFDATRIGYASYFQGPPSVYFLDLATRDRRKVISSKGVNFAPSWSPKGDRMAFCSTREGNAEIYLMNNKEEGLQRLTFHPAADLSPVWSQTGREIAFTSDRSGTPQIYIMDADGTNIRRLTYSGDYNTSASWSPRGDWIVYTCRNKAGYLKLCADQVSGQGLVSITEKGAWDDESPSWSPNGKEIVFASNRHGKSQIFAVRPDGTGLIQLTSDGGSNTSPDWAPR
jgi:TolB protein